MQFLDPKVLAFLTSLLHLSSTSPLASSDDSLATLDKRACGGGCDNQFPLARQVGGGCGCGQPYSIGDFTCSCSLEDIVGSLLFAAVGYGTPSQSVVLDITFYL